MIERLRQELLDVLNLTLERQDLDLVKLHNDLARLDIGELLDALALQGHDIGLCVFAPRDEGVGEVKVLLQANERRAA